MHQQKYEKASTDDFGVGLPCSSSRATPMLNITYIYKHSTFLHNCGLFCMHVPIFAAYNFTEWEWQNGAMDSVHSL